MLYGAAYYPEHRDPARWAHDLDLMAAAKVNALRVGEFAWDRFEPAPGAYDFGWLDRWLDRARPRGIGIVLCPPLRTPPAWLAERWPDAAIVRDDGVRLEFGSRYSFCVTHPALLDRAAALAERLARRYGGDAAVLGWHLDNEHGDEPDCHCPRCREHFRAYCRARYAGDIARLNDAWGLDFWSLRFNHFGQVPTPAASKTFHAPGHWLAWRRWRSEATVAAALRQRDALLPHRAAAQFITTNFQVVHNPRTDYYDFARHLDVCGTNFYPSYGRLGEETVGLAHVRGYRAGRNFHVFELKNSGHLVPGLGGNTPAPGEIARLAVQCVAHGAEGLFYFRWRACPFGCEQSHGTITDYDGRPLAAYDEAARVGKWLAEFGARLDATRAVADAAVLYDFPTRWTTEYRSQWNGPPGLYVAAMREAYAALRAAGGHVAMTGRDADWDAFRLLAVPGLAAVDDALADRLVGYVERGGTLVAWPQTAQRDAESRYFPGRLPPALAALFGLDLGDYWTAPEDASTAVAWTDGGPDAGVPADGAAQARLFGERARLAGAAPLAEYAGGPWAGFPAATVRGHGRGRAFAALAYPNRVFLDGLLARARRRAGLKTMAEQGLVDGPLPPSLEVVERAGDAERWLFALNHGDAPARVTLPPGGVDTWTGEAVGGDTEVAPGACRAVAYPC